MDEKKLHGLMGLCVRARQAIFGEDACMKAIRGGQCGVLLLDSRASAAITQKYAGVCQRAGVPLQRLPDGFLGSATGKPGVAMAIIRGGLCDQVLRLLAAQEENDNMIYTNNIGGVGI